MKNSFISLCLLIAAPLFLFSQAAEEPAPVIRNIRPLGGTIGVFKGLQLPSGHRRIHPTGQTPYPF